MKKRTRLIIAVVVICCLLTASLAVHAAFRYSAQTGQISIQLAMFDESD